MRMALAKTLFFSVVVKTSFSFRCDGMFSLIGGRVIPDSFVNDDYCDCDDRSDEPNTNACAMLTKSKTNNEQMFKCRDTKGYAPLAIASHLMGDGVCDCCDGSDEIEGLCHDDCAMWAAEEEAKLHAYEKAREEGKAKFNKYVELGKTAKVDYDKEIDELNVQLNQVELKVDEAQSLKETLSTKESETRATRKIESQTLLNRQLQLNLVIDPLSLLIRLALSAKDNGMQSLMALVVEKLDGAGTDSMDDVEVLSLATQAQELLNKQKEGSEEQEGQEGLEGLDTLVEDLKEALSLKNHPSFMQNQEGEEGAQGDGFDIAREMCLTLAQDLKEVNLLHQLSLQTRHQGENAQKKTFEVLEDPTQWDQWELPELIEVNSNLKTLNNEKRTITNKIKDVTIAENSDFGSSSEWFILSRQCFSKQTSGFDYKICPFKEAKQDNTNLGKWQGWGETTSNGQKIKVMKFDKGTKCWNGPARSLDVEVSCGSQDEILSVEEPETCKYVAQMTSPAACS